MKCFNVKKVSLNMTKVSFNKKRVEVPRWYKDGHGQVEYVIGGINKDVIGGINNNINPQNKYP